MMAATSVPKAAMPNVSTISASVCDRNPVSVVGDANARTNDHAARNDDGSNNSLHLASSDKIPSAPPTPSVQ